MKQSIFFPGSTELLLEKRVIDENKDINGIYSTRVIVMDDTHILFVKNKNNQLALPGGKSEHKDFDTKLSLAITGIGANDSARSTLIREISLLSDFKRNAVRELLEETPVYPCRLEYFAHHKTKEYYDELIYIAREFSSIKKGNLVKLHRLIDSYDKDFYSLGLTAINYVYVPIEDLIKELLYGQERKREYGPVLYSGIVYSHQAILHQFLDNEAKTNKKIKYLMKPTGI